MSETRATISFEIDIAVTGTLLKGYPQSGPTYSSGGEPGQPDMMEDVEIVDIGYLKLVRKTPEDAYRYKTLSLTEGVNMASPDVQRLLANLLEIVHEDAELALLDQIGEY